MINPSYFTTITKFPKSNTAIEWIGASSFNRNKINMINLNAYKCRREDNLLESCIKLVPN